MREWITAFFMAWGMFLAIPCPCKRWDERARQKMLVCLPLVGLVVGGVWAVLALLLRGAPVGLRALLLIPAATRACAGLAVMHLRPMGTSQYAAMRRGGADLTAALWIFLALAVGLPIWLAGSFAPLAAAVGYGLAAWYGFRQLDGMSGDISGFALTVGELVGAATLLYVG